MQLHELIATRRTVHKYAPKPVPADAIRRALEAAQWAPNHKLTWPWRFVVVGEQTRAVLTELGVRLKKTANPGMGAQQEAMVRQKLGNPGALVVVCQVRCDDDFRHKEDYASIAMAIQNIHLSLWNEGVYSKWGTGGITRHPETYAALGVDRNEQEIVGFLWIGYPAVVPTAASRPSLDEVVREVP